MTIAEHGLGSPEGTEVARYLERSGLLKEKPELIRMDVMQEDADEPRLIHVPVGPMPDPWRFIHLPRIRG